MPVDTPTNIHALLRVRLGRGGDAGWHQDVWAHRHGHMELYGETGSLYLPTPASSVARSPWSPPAGEMPVPLSWDHPFGRTNMEDNGGAPRANYRTAGTADMAAAITANHHTVPAWTSRCTWSMC
ncbi:MAG: hypothetical protein R3D59_09145 [Paracoccaceae bacterium]